jgi:hypothetical protein
LREFTGGLIALERFILNKLVQWSGVGWHEKASVVDRIGRLVRGKSVVGQRTAKGQGRDTDAGEWRTAGHDRGYGEMTQSLTSM